MSGRLADTTNRSAGSGEGQRPSIGFSPPALDFVRRSGRARGKLDPARPPSRMTSANTVRFAGNTVGEPMATHLARSRYETSASGVGVSHRG
jgi:hypothetical protein